MLVSRADHPTRFDTEHLATIAEKNKEYKLEYNPFTNELATYQAAYAHAGDQLHIWTSRLNWFQQFDPVKSYESLKVTERAINTAHGKLEPAKINTEALQIKISQLKEQACLGLNPRYWFSSERAIAQRQLLVASQDIAMHQRECDALKTIIQGNEQIAKQVQTDIDRYRSFDALLAQATLRGLQVELTKLDSELPQLQKRKIDLDSKLEHPLRRLAELEGEWRQLACDLSRADQFEEALTNAQTGRERAQIHEECGRELGHSKPMAVVQARRSKIEGVEGSIGKLKVRIEEIIKCNVRDVRTLVIDGNNLCYQQNEFIGLSALDKLVTELAKKYVVKLIFDSGIRGLLRTKDSEIREHFPQATLVHVVASKTKADETILDVAAGDKHAFVISNDRFVEFPEKDVVRQGRILKHDIVNDTVHIYELDILANFFQSERSSMATV